MSLTIDNVIGINLSQFNIRICFLNYLMKVVSRDFALTLMENNAWNKMIFNNVMGFIEYEAQSFLIHHPIGLFDEAPHMVHSCYKVFTPSSLITCISNAFCAAPATAKYKVNLTQELIKKHIHGPNYAMTVSLLRNFGLAFLEYVDHPFNKPTPSSLLEGLILNPDTSSGENPVNLFISDDGQVIVLKDSDTIVIIDPDDFSPDSEPLI